jgi:hypothetical protein
MRGIVVGLIILLFGLGITSASAIVNTAAN